jgi:predicted amidophosphoribosyltransferase
VPLELYSAVSIKEESEVFQGGARDLCVACRAEPFHVDQARSFARYEDLLVRAIVLLSFEEMDPLADWFVDRLGDVVAEHWTALQADVVVPVPCMKIARRSGV